MDISTIKNQILTIVKQEGPVLPVQISRKLGSDTIYAGAILSELVENKLVKITTAKIGGSPIYYVIGQEPKLSKLYDYLPGKEKEAYNLLKEKKILKDRECEPAIRVALRQIKDFAFPFTQGEEIYWKWYLSTNDEITSLVKKPEVKVEEPILKQKKIEIEKKPVKVKQEVKNEFLDDIKSYLVRNGIQLVEEKQVKKNELNFTVKINSNLGELNYLLVAVNKKKLSDSDLALAHNKGQRSKLPVIFLSNADLTKKAQKYLEEISGLLVYRKL